MDCVCLTSVKKTAVHFTSERATCMFGHLFLHLNHHLIYPHLASRLYLFFILLVVYLGIEVQYLMLYSTCLQSLYLRIIITNISTTFIKHVLSLSVNITLIVLRDCLDFKTWLNCIMQMKE